MVLSDVVSPNKGKAFMLCNEAIAEVVPRGTVDQNLRAFEIGMRRASEAAMRLRRLQGLQRIMTGPDPNPNQTPSFSVARSGSAQDPAAGGAAEALSPFLGLSRRLR